MEVEDMRAVELSSPKQSKQGSDKPSPKANPQEVKSLNNKIKKSETRIADLERDIKKLESMMGEDGFYESSESEDTLKRYTSLKDELGKTYDLWEELQLSLESLIA